MYIYMDGYIYMDMHIYIYEVLTYLIYPSRLGMYGTLNELNQLNHENIRYYIIAVTATYLSLNCARDMQKKCRLNAHLE